MYTLQFDGLFRGGSQSSEIGPKCWIFVLWLGDLPSWAVVAHGHGAYARSNNATANIAEYLALIEGLDALLDFGIFHEEVWIVGDAKCVIDQMKGIADVNASSIKPLYARAARIARKFQNLIWCWTPRKNNHQADQLTRRAMRQLRQDRNTYQAAVIALSPKNEETKSKRFMQLMDLRVYRT